MTETATRDRTLRDQRAREVIRTELDRNIMVLAGAGAGKTHELVERMVAAVRRGTDSVDRMAAITFTRKAAGEMRGRFLIRLREELERVAGAEADRVRRAMSLIDQCFIGTIHAFCGRLLRERPIEAGLAPEFTEVEEREEALIRRDAWDAFVRDRFAAGDERLPALEEYGIHPEDLFSFFGRRCAESDVELKETSTARPDLEDEALGVVRFVDECLPYVPIRPEKRDGLMNVLRRARHFLENHGLEDARDRATLLKLFEGEVKIVQKLWGDRKDFSKRALKELLPELREQWVNPGLRLWRESAFRLVADFVDDAVAHYARIRQERAVVTFQDLLLRTAALLCDFPEVRAYFQRRYRVLMVDEFQDTDPIQARIVMYLTGEDIHEKDWRALRPRPGSLFLVGDDKQSIYRFRRADVDVFREVRELIAATGGEVVRLNTSFRSLGRLCGWISGSFPSIFEGSSPHHQAEFSPLHEYRPAGVDPHCVRTITTAKVHGNRRPPITKADAGRIADFIAAALRGETSLNSLDGDGALGERAAPEDFMILTRTSTMLSVYAQALEERNIPFDIVGGGRLGTSIEVRALVTLLETVYEPDNPLHFLAFLRGPLVGLADDELYAFRSAGGYFTYYASPPESLDDDLRERLDAATQLLRDAEEVLISLPPGAAIEKILETSGLLAYASVHPDGRASSRAGNLLRLLSFVRRLSAEGRAWGEILEEMKALVGEGAYDLEEMTLEAGREDVVRIMNLHQAKGLQARVVFLADPYDQSPYRHSPDRHVSRRGSRSYLSMTVSKPKGERGRELLAQPEGWDEDVAEEKLFQDAEEVRLLYVAATRARNLLVVSCYDGNRDSGPWHPLYDHLADVPELECCPAEGPSEGPREEIDWRRMRAELPARHEHARESTYELRRISGSAEEEGIELASREGRGRDYGTIIHQLFEDAVNDRLPADPTFVRSVALEAGLDDLRAAEAFQALTRFRDSDIWKEVRRADRVFTEVPMGRPAAGSVERGIIDLIYRVDGRWKIVDYKTDAAPTSEEVDRVRARYEPQIRAYANFWREATGEPVEEVSIYLVHGPPPEYQLRLF